MLPQKRPSLLNVLCHFRPGGDRGERRGGDRRDKREEGDRAAYRRAPGMNFIKLQTDPEMLNPQDQPECGYKDAHSGDPNTGQLWYSNGLYVSVLVQCSLV